MFFFHNYKINDQTAIVKYFLAIVVLLSIGFGTPAFSTAGEGLTSYKIGIGDILRISTWEEPDLSLDAAMVRSDGMITFPLLNDIKAAGLTTMELKEILEKELKEYVEVPNITVTLANPVSQRFYILGEVINTGEYPITKKLTVMQAFALAGGFTEWASKKEILLIRRINGKEETITINYKEILKGNFSKDIALKADDTIIVP